ncbi:MAG: trypsin-like peptidase domain-containing protein [Anaerolineales bacterium]|jgi:2-alkenal reductase
MKRILMVLIVLGVLAMACSGTMPVTNATPTPTVATATQTPTPATSLVGADGSLAALYDKVNPGVVTIIAYGPTGSGNDALGSGFVIDTKGDILTNMHVIASAKSIEVDFPSGFMTQGTIAAKDPDSDVAVIHVDAPASELHPLTLGDSSKVNIGDPVIAIGNPFALYNTLTFGIVSAKGRTDESLSSSSDTSFYIIGDMIQTDAALNPGNSGGPLFNMQGEVIGINRSILSPSTSQGGTASNTGLGFAVSSNLVRRILPDLLATGKYDYPYLGLGSLTEIHLQAQQELGLPYTYGVYITSVTAGGPADKAGLRAGTVDIPNVTDLKKGGDLIIAINGQKVNNFGDMVSYIVMNFKPGDSVKFTVYRDGASVDVPVTLGSRPSA